MSRNQYSNVFEDQSEAKKLNMYDAYAVDAEISINGASICWCSSEFICISRAIFQYVMNNFATNDGIMSKRRTKGVKNQSPGNCNMVVNIYTTFVKLILG